MLLAETISFDNRTYSTSREYDVGSRPISQTFNDGKNQTWTYDKAENMTSVTQGEGTNNVISNRIYNADNELTALNKIVARAVEGDKTQIEWYHKNYLDHLYAVSDNNGNTLEN